MSASQVYRIIALVKKGKNTKDQRPQNPKKTVRTPDIVASVAAAVENNRRLNIRKLAQKTHVSYGTIHNILHKDLGMSKKSARWVPKLLTEDQKRERARISQEFLELVEREEEEVLGKILTIDESMVSLHTPETKRQSMQWIKKGEPGPIKARVHATRSKVMVLAFFDQKGVVYTNYVPKGVTVNAAYILKILPIFIKKLRLKRPTLADGGWFLHWDNAPVHTAAAVRLWLEEHNVQVIPHPPYSPDLAPADFFLFPKVKELLAGQSLTVETVKLAWNRP